MTFQDAICLLTTIALHGYYIALQLRYGHSIQAHTWKDNVTA